MNAIPGGVAVASGRVEVAVRQAAGLGICEDARGVTGNLSRFVPHLF